MVAGRRSGPEAGPARWIREILAPRRPGRIRDEELDRRAAVAMILRGGRGGHDEDRAAPDGRGSPEGRSPRPPAESKPGPASYAPLVPELREVEALFVLRAEREEDPWSGQVGLPGGHREPGDPDLAGAALREVEEETGLVLAPSAVLGRLDEIHPRSRHLPSVAVTPFVVWDEGEARVCPGPEVADHFWVPLEELDRPERRSVLTLSRGGAFRAFPTVEYRGYTIWGLTFVILSRFLSLLPRLPGGGTRPREPVGPGGPRGEG